VTQLRRPVGFLALLIALLCAVGCDPAVEVPASAQAAEASMLDVYVPTLEDARRTAAEQLKVIPAGARQVECAPGVATFPPYTTQSGGMSRIHRMVLADGRCFEWEGVRDPRTMIEVIVPTDR
jgi:hypothetical protein